MYKKVILALLLSVSIIACKKNEQHQKLSKCDLTGRTLTFKNKLGMLTYTDSLHGFKLSSPHYFIFDLNPDLVFQTLEPCNLPKDFKNIPLNQGVSVKFSGNIELQPPYVDSFSNNCELSKIELAHPNEK